MELAYLQQEKWKGILRKNIRGLVSFEVEWGSESWTEKVIEWGCRKLRDKKKKVEWRRRV